MENKEITLAARSMNPFEGYTDWTAQDIEKTVVVTITHMGVHLYSQWSNQAVSYPHPDCRHDDWEERLNCDKAERQITHENFSASTIREPGVYKDCEYVDDYTESDELYTIIIPYNFMSERLCRKYLGKLNEEYNRKFSLSYTEEQEEEKSTLEKDGSISVINLNGKEKNND